MRKKWALLGVILYHSVSFAADDAKNVKMLFSTGPILYETATLHAQIASSAVVLASRLQGASTWITTGTLTQYAPTLTSFRYDASPTDRLIVTFLSGQSMQYIFRDFQGEYTGEGDNFLSKDHRIIWEEKFEPASSLEMGSAQLQGTREGYIKGNAVVAGEPYRFDVTLSGTYHFSNDRSGSEYRAKQTMRGIVETQTQLIFLNENIDGEIVSAQNPNASTSIVSRSSRLVASRLQMGDTIYEASARIQKVFKEGKPSENTYWQGTTGQITLKGKLLVKILATYEYPYQKIKAVLQDGKEVELESW